MGLIGQNIHRWHGITAAIISIREPRNDYDNFLEGGGGISQWDLTGPLRDYSTDIKQISLILISI